MIGHRPCARGHALGLGRISVGGNKRRCRECNRQRCQQRYRRTYHDPGRTYATCPHGYTLTGAISMKEGQWSCRHRGHRKDLQALVVLEATLRRIEGALA